MTVDALAAPRRLRIRDVRLGSALKQRSLVLHSRKTRLCLRLGAIFGHHSPHERVALARDDANNLGAALEEPARGRALVCASLALPSPRAQEARIRELQDQLRPCVGRCARRLDRLFSVARLDDVHRLRRDKLRSVFLRACDTLFERGIERPMQLRQHRGRQRRGRGRAVVERGVRQRTADRIGECQRRRAVHDGVLAHESRTRAIEYDQLNGLVYPAVTEPIRRAVPQEARGRQKVARCCGIEAEQEGSRVDRVEQHRI